MSGKNGNGNNGNDRRVKIKGIMSADVGKSAFCGKSREVIPSYEPRFPFFVCVIKPDPFKGIMVSLGRNFPEIKNRLCSAINGKKRESKEEGIAVRKILKAEDTTTLVEGLNKLGRLIIKGTIKKKRARTNYIRPFSEALRIYFDDYEEQQKFSPSLHFGSSVTL
ncbi:MAG: hypothetical protein PHD51_02480 [Patescibacteria group bacterium]|nr:hypothetical protein [Patescibacteria group bacterium]MDD5490272.1 hypothetical protein [Patescibacteria group bacterium]